MTNNLNFAKPTIYPTLVIGLGGVGTNVVRHAKRRFLRNWNPNGGEDLPSLLQVLAVDTEPLVNHHLDEPLHHNEFAFLGKFDATKLIQNKKNHGRHLDWWGYDEKEVPLGYIHNGAKQLRPIGRLAFVRNYVTFRTLLTDKLLSMKKQEDIAEAQERGFEVAQGFQLVYIVSSLCGGTGSGMLLDVVHVVRHQIGVNGSIIGVLMLPSIFQEEIRSAIQRDRIKANAYATLKELDHYQQTQDFQQYYPSESEPIPRIKYRPFDTIFLVEQKNQDGISLKNKASAEKMAAHMIHLTAFSHLNNKILAQDVNITRERNAKDSAGSTQFLAYSTFGVSALTIQSQALAKYARHKLVQRLSQRASGNEMSEEQMKAKVDEQIEALFSQINEKSRGYLSKTKTKEIDEFGFQIDQESDIWRTFEEQCTNSLSAIEEIAGILGVIRFLQLLVQRTNVDNSTDPRNFNNPKRWGLIQGKRGNSIVDGVQYLWNTLWRQREAIKRTRREREAALLYEVRHTTIKKLNLRIRNLAEKWTTPLKQDMDSLKKLDSISGQEASNNYASISPKVSTNDPLTRTYYDLETGGIGEREINRIDAWIDGILAQKTRSDNREMTQDRALLHELWEKLMQAGSISSLDIEGMRALITSCKVYTDINESFIKNVDIRAVVGVADADGHAVPNERLEQLFGRLSPFATVDGDTYPHTTANEEHIKAATTPTDSDKENHKDFDRGMKKHRDFSQIPNGDATRMDAVYIVHGLAAGQLESMADMYEKYWGDQFPQETLHIYPENWNREGWNEPYRNPLDPNAEKRKETLRKKSE